MFRIIGLLLISTLWVRAQSREVLPSASQVEWANAEIGAIIHFDVVNFVPDYNWRKWGSHPPASVFNPKNLDTDQWIRTAKAAGAKYVVLVAKHGSGFSLWPTKAHEYSVKNAPWKQGKGDLVADFIQSCKKYGIKPGIYASASANGFLHVDDPGKVQPGSPIDQKTYNSIVVTQLTELWSNYGPLFEIWFDGGVIPVKDGGPDLAPVLKRLQPEAILFQGPSDAKNLIRWVGNEDGLAPYPNWSRINASVTATGTLKPAELHGNPEGDLWCPGETDFPLRTGWQGGWFWKASQQKILSLEKLVDNYRTSVGRNSNMLIGIVVDTTGQVPREDVDRLESFGREITKRFTKPIAQMKSTDQPLTLTLGKTPVSVGEVVFSEDISKGERIRNYSIEAWQNGKWQAVATGTSVGHKRIHHFDNLTTTQLRLVVTESKQSPVIQEFAAYRSVE